MVTIDHELNLGGHRNVAMTKDYGKMHLDKAALLYWQYDSVLILNHFVNVNIDFVNVNSNGARD